jgi:hypothetical protein
VDSSTEEIATVAARPQHARRPPRHARRPFASLPVHSTQTAHSTLAVEDIGPESEEVAAEDVVDPLLSMDSDPLLSVAQDSQEPEEVIVLLAADGVVPDSQEVAADSVNPLQSVEAPQSFQAPLQCVEAPLQSVQAVMLGHGKL